jgi:uncharacterized protein (TIGR03083 family)
MDHEQRLEQLRTQIDVMAKATAGADLSAPVPSCPDWDLGELLRHTGRVHRWVTGFAATGTMEFPGWSKSVTDVPEHDAALPEWLAAGAVPLLDALSADPATPVWSFVGDANVGWWSRRMMQETTVHRADAELALGLDPVLDPAIAVDGVEELIGVLLPARGGPANSRALDRVGDSLHLHATDITGELASRSAGTVGEWTIVLTEDGYDWSAAHTKATAAVRGTASDLLLLLWNRREVRDAERFETFGDVDLVAAWTKATGF